LQAGLGGGVGFVDGLGAEVGQFDRFDVAPDHLDGVEVVGVAGESFDEQPVALGGDPGGHRLALTETARYPLPPGRLFRRS
jgi:hypothetical protein